ncbi:MAG: tetratricopeptide repeat protein [Caldilineae bacterium]|nr:tetratricopeptide repeat protein [Chloroflexota bacterium]MCB9177699.1 tetratricopeptide repeat protein [Caldilineae bacterium]
MPLRDGDNRSFLFTDIVGSTQLWEEYPDAMAAALERHDALLQSVMDRHGGHVFNVAGDAFSVAFESPHQALLAAIDAQLALAAEEWGETGPLVARMALHAGEVVLRDGDYVGQPLNRCARLLDTAHGQQVILSGVVAEAVADHLPEGVRLRDLGLHRLRDLRQPEQIHQVCHPGLPDQFPPLRSLDALPNNLPVQLTRFIGRRHEMAELERLLRESRLVTLTGTGGSGKTRLALQVAAELSDALEGGAWLVELGALSDPELLPQAVANALGLRPPSRQRPRQDGRPTAAGAGRGLWLSRLSQFIAQREMLLILDNCEHLVEACAWLAESLLQACPRLRILATSREALQVAGEASYRVPSLSVPGPELPDDPERLRGFESVRLFVNRARKVQPGFELSAANAGDVAQICRRLDGIPLAIELAAVRVKLMTPGQIAERLDDRFRLLTGGSRNAVPRQQTLRAAIDWSYELLSGSERALLGRLAVFRQGFTLEAAEAICGDLGPSDGIIVDQGIMQLLAQLVDKSLVLFDERLGRYHMLQTVLHYALERLVTSGEASTYRQRHQDYFLALARDAETRLQGPEQLIWLARLQAEHGNLRAALDWALDGADRPAALGLAAALWFFWFVRGYLAEGRDWLDRTLDLPGDAAATPERAQALLGAGALAWRQRDYLRAESSLQAALQAFSELGDERGVARTTHFLGRVAQFQGDYALAAERFEASLVISRAVDDRRGIATTLDVMGLAAWQQGDYAQAVTWLQQSLEMAREMGDLRGVAASLNILGRVAHDRGDYARATELYEDSLEVFQALGDEVDIAYIYNKLGNVARHLGDLDRAEQLLEESYRRSRELGERRGMAYALGGLGNVDRVRGQRARAQERFETSLRLAREIGDKRGIADALRNLGWLAADAEDTAQAFILHSEALERYAEMGDKLGIAEGLAGVAGAIAERMPARAARLLGAATGLRETIGAPLPPGQQDRLAEELERLRALLGAREAGEAAREGRRMTVAEAMAQARELLARPAF